MRGVRIHGDGFLQILGGLRDRKLAQRQLHVHFHAQRAQPHHVVDNLARSRTIVEHPCLEQHLFRVKADAFIGPGIVVVTADRIRVRPGKRQLKIVSRHTLVNNSDARILGVGQREVSQVGARRIDVANTILLQPARARKIISLAHSLQRLHISRHRLIRVALHPGRHRQDVLVLQIFPDGFFILTLVRDFFFYGGRNPHLTRAPVAMLLVGLKSNGAGPLVLPDRKQLLWRVRQERDVLEKKNIAFPSQRALRRHGGQLPAEPIAVILQRLHGGLGGSIDLLLRFRIEQRLQFADGCKQARPDIVQLTDRQFREGLHRLRQILASTVQDFGDRMQRGDNVRGALTRYRWRLK